MRNAIFGDAIQKSRKHLSRFSWARQLYVKLKRLEFIIADQSSFFRYLSNLNFKFQKQILQFKFRRNRHKLASVADALIDRNFISRFYGPQTLRETSSDPWAAIRTIHQLADPNEFFDCDWYYKNNPARFARADSQNLLTHFLLNLAKVGARPSPNLSTNFERFRDCIANADLTNSETRTLEKIFCRNSEENLLLATTKRAPKSNPRVAVLVPVFNNWLWTERCLRSLILVENNAAFDIFVADDASTDQTVEEIQKRFSDIILIQNEQNAGFLKNCNQAFDAITAQNTYDFVYLLNNDAEVAAGWLDELLLQVESNPSIGIAGSALLYPDLSLQEVGGIVWQDGSAWNFGRHETSTKAKHRVTREVDYVSGAGILINLKAFPRGLAFDTRFLPAYYEDTDLAMQARNNGFSVVVNPLSKVIHHEGKSHGVDLTAGVKASQEKNQLVFQAKWTKHLENHHRSIPELVDSAAFRLEVAERPEAIIWIDYQLPDQSRDSGSVRALALMKLAKQVGRYVLFVPQRPQANSLKSKILESEGIPVFGSLKEAISFARRANFRVSTAWISRIDTFNQYFKELTKLEPRIKILFDTVDLHALRLNRVEILSGRFTKSLEKELDAIKKSDASIVVSSFEQKLIASYLPDSNINVISNVHSPTLENYQDRKGIVFVGSFNHHPNQEGMVWFMANVWPILPEEIRAEGLKIVGQNPSTEVISYASHDVFVTGWVPESSEYVRSAKLSIAPLLSGAGVKGKIGEALSMGTPVVTTTIGAEGMNLENNVNALIADTPVKFAEAIVAAMANEKLRRTIAANGMRIVKEYFSVDIARVELERLLNETVSKLKQK